MNENVAASGRDKSVQPFAGDEQAQASERDESPEALPCDEIAIKHRWWNSATVDARLHGAFRATDTRAAALLIATLVGDVPGADGEASDIASCRLILDALKVSDGDLGTLALWVEVAYADPRDLIAAAEYRRELTEPGTASRGADLEEYLAWCAGK